MFGKEESSEEGRTEAQSGLSRGECGRRGRNTNPLFLTVGFEMRLANERH